MLRNLKGIIILEISNIFETRILTMVAHYLRVQFFQNCTTGVRGQGLGLGLELGLGFRG